MTRLGLLAVVLSASLGALLGCGGGQPNADDASRADLDAPSDDGSRCTSANRSDRVALEFRGAAATRKNIRRVFALGASKKGERVLRCREIDTNLDGVKDVFRTYNQRGLPAAEVADSDYDGKVDTWLRFSGSLVSEARFDRNKDGTPDEFRIYSGGHLARARLDTTLDGKIDTWEVYDSGRLRRVGRDVDGDGQVDVWERDQQFERARARERAQADARSEQRSDVPEPDSAAGPDAAEDAANSAKALPKPLEGAQSDDSE